VVTTYVDTSALVALYIPEAHSPRARRLISAAGPVPFTSLHELELGNAFRLLYGRGVLTASQVSQVNDLVAEDRHAARLFDQPLDLHRVILRAVELSSLHTPKILCRSLDILHVASAIELRATRLISGDSRQLALAKACKMLTANIKRPQRG
jgi:predicted nucleic acid-binding protein